MDIGKWGSRAADAVKKYRWPVLVLILGLVLLMLPTGSKTEKKAEAPRQTQAPQPDIQAQLEAILSQIQGVGKVKVMLTQAAGERYVYQFDEDTGKETVIITDGDRNESPVISQVLPPEFLGAIIVCQGAKEPAVKLAVVEAVSKLTGLSSDRISVSFSIH